MKRSRVSHRGHPGDKFVRLGTLADNPTFCSGASIPKTSFKTGRVFMRHVAFFAATLLIAGAGTANSQENTPDYSPYVDQSHPDRVFWGDTHLHTSFEDALTTPPK